MKVFNICRGLSYFRITQEMKNILLSTEKTKVKLLFECISSVKHNFYSKNSIMTGASYYLMAFESEAFTYETAIERMVAVAFDFDMRISRPLGEDRVIYYYSGVFR